MKDMYNVEVDKSEINVNDPACHNKNPEEAEYNKMGFWDKVDYECYKRRMSDRSKG